MIIYYQSHDTCYTCEKIWISMKIIILKTIHACMKGRIMSWVLFLNLLGLHFFWFFTVFCIRIFELLVEWVMFKLFPERAKKVFYPQEEKKREYFETASQSCYIDREKTFRIPIGFFPNWDTTGILIEVKNKTHIILSQKELDTFLVRFPKETNAYQKWHSFHKTDVVTAWLLKKKQIFASFFYIRLSSFNIILL